MRIDKAFGLVFLIAALPASRAGADDPLLKGFRDPPPACRMRMFWRVFGPAWETEEIDYELRLMKHAGIGGVMTSFFYPVSLDNPDPAIHNQRLGSPEFLDTFRYAATRANEMGLRFGVFGGSGWPYGGPEVSVEDSARRIRQMDVKRNVAGDGWTLPRLARGERFVAAFAGTRKILLGRDAAGATVIRGVDPTDLHVFVSGPTRMRVKRPAFGGEGLVLDHYRADSTRRYLDTVVAPMLAAATGRVNRLFCDSLEVYGSNWTEDFPRQFQNRRGYDIVARLPELFDHTCAASGNLRFDFWRTLAELTEERFTRVVAGWARAHGTRLEMEAYGSPPNPLTAARYIDFPCGEQYEWQGFSMSRLAASGAHLSGRKLVSAEAWTWVGLPNRLADTLRELKLASDIHFLAGCNDLIGVDFPYSPRNLPPPGWQPYYGPTMNQNNPQWPYFHALVEYVNRCQWMLRQGKPVADVAIYLPVEDVFASGPIDQMLLDFHLRDRFATGEKTGEFGLASSMHHHSDLIHTLLTHGYNYDGIDFWSIDRYSQVRNGKLVCGDGEYSIVILPTLEGIDADALDKLTEFVRAGGTLVSVGRLPQKSYGVNPRRRESSRSILFTMLTGKPTDRRAECAAFGRGKIYTTLNDTTELAAILANHHSDVTMEPYQPGIGFVHRRAGDREIYFFANLDPSTKRFMADFAPARMLNNQLKESDMRAYYSDPLTGRVEIDAMGYTGNARPTQLPIELAPYGSVFVILGSSGAGAPPLTTSTTHDPGAAHPGVLTESWHLRFEGPDAPKPREVDTLISWTSWPDAKYFSGQGIYSTTFEWQKRIPNRCKIRFESVREAGEVFVNGRSAGIVWMEPLEAEIAPLLKQGTNELKVVVGNVPANRFIGLPDEDLRPIRAVYGDRFPAPREKQIMTDPRESGLIGRVWLVTDE